MLRRKAESAALGARRPAHSSLRNFAVRLSQDRVSAAASPGKKARPSVDRDRPRSPPFGDLWHFRGEERHCRLGP